MTKLHPAAYFKEKDRQFYFFFIKRIRQFILRANEKYTTHPFKYLLILLGIVFIFIDCKFGETGKNVCAFPLIPMSHLFYLVPLLVWLMIVVAIGLW